MNAIQKYLSEHEDSELLLQAHSAPKFYTAAIVSRFNHDTLAFHKAWQCNDVSLEMALSDLEDATAQHLA